MNLINPTKIYRTQQQYNWISIAVPNAGIVEGALQEQVTYSVEANYNTIFSLDSYFNDLNSVATLTLERSLFRTGLFTKRFWKSGGYLKINPKFRIVDHEGTGEVIQRAAAILNSALPTSDLKSVADKIEGMAGRISKGVAGEGGAEEFGSATSTAASIVAGGLTLKTTGSVRAGVVAGVVTKLLTDTDTLTSIIEGVSSNQPKPVVVNISNYFEKIFVAENVSVTFSQEMIETKNGTISPLYADFDCVFGTQEITTFGQTGLNAPTKRFKIQQ